MRSRLTVLAALLFAALPAFAHGEQVLYPLIAAGFIVPVIFLIRATSWFNGRGAAIVCATSALLALGLTRLETRSGCFNFILIVFGPSLATLFVVGVAYQFDSLRE